MKAKDISSYAIFIISNEPWGKQWLSKHHYANELAKMEFMVYFIDPVGRWSWKNIFNFSIIKKNISENLVCLSYVNFFPVRIFTVFFTHLNDWINSIKLQPLVAGKQLIIWQFDPFRFTKKFYRNTFKIYHIVDPYTDLPLDTYNANYADLLICTSKIFFPYYQKFNKPVIHIPHGVAEEEFNYDHEIIESLENKYGRFIFHAGSISDRIDIGLIRQVIEKFPDKNIIFVGPNQITDEKKKCQFEACLKKLNFFYLGIVPADQIKNYVKASVACLLCYEFLLSQGSNPLKALNYLAQKRVIVSSMKLECDELIDQVIFYANDEQEYLEVLDKVLNGRIKPKTDKVDSFLQNRKYPTLLEKIFKYIH